MVDGMGVDQSSNPSRTCEACIQAKQAHTSFPQEAQHQSTEPGERVVSDVWGPAKVTSIGGWKYYIFFTDDTGCFVSPLFLSNKTQAFDRIKEHVLHIKRRFGKAPKYLRIDNGTELINEKLKKFAGDAGIAIEITAPYSPSQNGIAERFNRTLLELARAMLIAKNLPQFLWDEAVAHAAYLQNREPTKAVKGKTLYEVWNGKMPNVAHLRKFGCNVWILDESNNRSKLDPKSKKMVFVGFMDGSKLVHYYKVRTRKIKVSRNFTFNENEEPNEWTEPVDLPGLQAEGENIDTSSQQTLTPETKEDDPTIPEPIPTSTTQSTAPVDPPQRQLRTRKEDIDYKKIGNPQACTASKRFSIGSTAPSTPPNIGRPTISSHTKSTPKERANMAVQTLLEALLDETEISYTSNNVDLPQTQEEALDRPESGEWQAAMDEEIFTLKGMGTWRMEDLPSDRKTIGCRWVFTKKRDEHRNIIKYKARLVAQGFSQKPGTDYSNDGTFAPVMRFETLRTVLAYSAVHNLKLRQFDVKGAYLHGRLQKTIYMCQPPGYEDGTHQVCLLVRSLYGLKQAVNVWNHELNRVLQELGFMQLKTDYCCYI